MFCADRGHGSCWENWNAHYCLTIATHLLSQSRCSPFPSSFITHTHARTHAQFSDCTISVTMETNCLGTISWSPSVVLLAMVTFQMCVCTVCCCRQWCFSISMGTDKSMFIFDISADMLPSMSVVYCVEGDVMWRGLSPSALLSAESVKESVHASNAFCPFPTGCSLLYCGIYSAWCGNEGWVVW